MADSQSIPTRLTLPQSNPPGEDDARVIQSIVSRVLSKNDLLAKIIMTKQAIELCDIEQELAMHAWKNLLNLSEKNKKISINSLYNFLRLRLYEMALNVRKAGSSARDVTSQYRKVTMILSNEDEENEEKLRYFEETMFNISQDGIETHAFFEYAKSHLNDRESVIISFICQGMSPTQLIQLGFCSRREFAKIRQKLKNLL